MKKSTLALARRAWVAGGNVALRLVAGSPVADYYSATMLPASTSRRKLRKQFERQCAKWRGWGVTEIAPQRTSH